MSRIVLGLDPLFREARVLGRAWPCSCTRGDNLGLHKALAVAPPASVLVCDTGGDVRHGYFGELMAIDALSRGVRGLVIDGSVRDTPVLSARRFPVFCRGFAPQPCTKESHRTLVSAVLDGVTVTAADIVIADADGVAFVARDQFEDVLSRVEALERKEKEIKEALASGGRLASIMLEEENINVE